MGLMNIRGELITIIDLKILFELPKQDLTNLNKVIVIEYDDLVLGILVDSVVGVTLVYRNEIQSGLPTLTDIRADFLYGVTKDHLIIIDAVKFINDIKMN